MSSSQTSTSLCWYELWGVWYEHQGLYWEQNDFPRIQSSLACFKNLWSLLGLVPKTEKKTWHDQDLDNQQNCGLFATMVASAVFITDLQGKAIISRNYRGDVPLAKAIERFAKYLVEVEDEAKKPVFHVDTNGDVSVGDDVGASGPGGEHFVYVSVSTKSTCWFSSLPPFMCANDGGHFSKTKNKHFLPMTMVLHLEKPTLCSFIFSHFCFYCAHTQTRACIRSISSYIFRTSRTRPIINSAHKSLPVCRNSQELECCFDSYLFVPTGTSL